MAAGFLLASVFDPGKGYSLEASGPAIPQVTAPEGNWAVAAPCGAVHQKPPEREIVGYFNCALQPPFRKQLFSPNSLLCNDARRSDIGIIPIATIPTRESRWLKAIFTRHPLAISRIPLSAARTPMLYPGNSHTGGPWQSSERQLVAENLFELLELASREQAA